MHSITVYTQPACGQCMATKRKLDKLGLDYRVVDVAEPDQEDARDYVVNTLGYATAPVVEVDGDDHWGGYHPGKLEALAQ